MKKIFLTTLIVTISICVLSQEQYVLDLENKFKLVTEVAESSFIRIKPNTPVYRTHELTGLIEFEFPKDTTVAVVMYNYDYIVLADDMFINPKYYVINSFYSTKLDSIVAAKVNFKNLIAARSIPNNTKIIFNEDIEVTVDTTYRSRSKISTRDYGGYITVLGTSGNYYKIRNKKLHDREFYINRDYLDPIVTAQLESNSENLLPVPIRKLNAGQELQAKPSGRSNFRGVLISTFRSGNYSSRTYRRGNTYETVTTYNGETSTSYYTQY